MRKIDLIKRVTAWSDINQCDVHRVVENLFFQLAQAMERGEPVFIRGFGTFKTRIAKAKIGRNVKKNTEVAINERVVPVFKASKNLRTNVADNLPF